MFSDAVFLGTSSILFLLGTSSILLMLLVLCYVLMWGVVVGVAFCLLHDGEDEATGQGCTESPGSHV